MTDKTIEQLKAAAIAEVDLKHPLVAYHKHLNGREEEYTYREFLDEVTPQEEQQIEFKEEPTDTETDANN